MKNRTEIEAKKTIFRKSLLNKTDAKGFLTVFGSVLFLFLFSGASLCAQDLPDEIRGYKVKRAKISVKTANDKSVEKSKFDVFVNVGDPTATNISLTGVTFEMPVEIDALEQSGTVDFLTFKDFRLNNRAVDIEEYRNSFEFKKNQRITLPQPIKIYINAAQGLLGTISEVTDSKEEWTVTGRIFVFGKFKKFGMNFKRAVPVDVNIKIKNPVKDSPRIF